MPKVEHSPGYFAVRLDVCPLCGVEFSESGGRRRGHHVHRHIADCPNRELFRRLHVAEAQELLKQYAEHSEVTLTT